MATILGVDPSLTRTGFALVSMEPKAPPVLLYHAAVRGGTGKMARVLRARRILAGVTTAVAEAGEAAADAGVDIDRILIEDPLDQVLTPKRGRAPATIGLMGFAVGVVTVGVEKAAGLIGRFPPIYLVSVKDWYPRDGRRIMRHDDVVTLVQRLLPGADALNDDETMAAGLALWGLSKRSWT